MCIRDSYNRIYDNPDMALDLYTRQCSLGITAQQLGIAACLLYTSCRTWGKMTWANIYYNYKGSPSLAEATITELTNPENYTKWAPLPNPTSPFCGAPVCL